MVSYLQRTHVKKHLWGWSCVSGCQHQDLEHQLAKLKDAPSICLNALLSPPLEIFLDCQKSWMFRKNKMEQEKKQRTQGASSRPTITWLIRFILVLTLYWHFCSYVLLTFSFNYENKQSRVHIGLKSLSTFFIPFHMKIVACKYERQTSFRFVSFVTLWWKDYLVCRLFISNIYRFINKKWFMIWNPDQV